MVLRETYLAFFSINLKRKTRRTWYLIHWSTCIVVTTPFRFTLNMNYDECTIILDNHQIKVILYISITSMFISIRKNILVTFDLFFIYTSIKYIWMLYDFLWSNLFCHLHGIIHMVEFRYDINYYCSDILLGILTLW